jgi:uncharacterized protein
MAKEAILKILSRFRKVIEDKNIKVDKLILFGSYAHGTFKEESDIDILVISDDFADKDFWQRIDILSDAIYEVFEPIEAVAITTAEWNTGASTVVDFAQDGEVVYAA